MAPSSAAIRPFLRESQVAVKAHEDNAIGSLVLHDCHIR